MLGLFPTKHMLIIRNMLGMLLMKIITHVCPFQKRVIYETYIVYNHVHYSTDACKNVPATTEDDFFYSSLIHTFSLNRIHGSNIMTQFTI